MDSTTSKSFFGFLFNMKDPETNTMNMLQYSFIALIPIIILLKIVNIIPEANESKGSIEILFEIILQLIIIIIGIVIIHRFTIYFNTLSKVPYPEIQTFSIVLFEFVKSMTSEARSWMVISSSLPILKTSPNVAFESMTARSPATAS